MHGTSSRYSGRQWLGLLITLAFHSALQVQAFHSVVKPVVPTRLYASSAGDDNEIPNADAPSEGDSAASVSPAAVTLDEGGIDLTDRFKYKVHALMGDYDPAPGAADDENQTGNIIGAMLEFPSDYTFTVVGRAADSAGDQYASDVKQALVSVLGSDAKMEMRVVPRGKSFTRVTAKLTVESASMISFIYEELDALEATVMKF